MIGFLDVGWNSVGIFNSLDEGDRNEFRKTFKEEHPDVKGVTMVSVPQFLHVLCNFEKSFLYLVLHLELLNWHLQSYFFWPFRLARLD